MKKTKLTHFKKPAVFLRHSKHEGIGSKLIVIWPDGRMAKSTYLFWTGPCYAPKLIDKKDLNDFGKFKTPKDAYEAMRKYEKFTKCNKAIFIGYC